MAESRCESTTISCEQLPNHAWDASHPHFSTGPDRRTPPISCRLSPERLPNTPDGLMKRGAVGQHVDVRLTTPDGYQTERSYSIASALDDGEQVALTVERMEDGEVSPYLVDGLAKGDQLELRGAGALGDRWGSGIGSKINPKNSAALEQSFYRCLNASTVTDAIGEIGDRVHGSRGIEIVIQSGAYLRNVWSRIRPRPASHGRVEPGQHLSARL